MYPPANTLRAHHPSTRTVTARVLVPWSLALLLPLLGAGTALAQSREGELLRAVNDGNVPKVRELLEAGVSADARDETDLPALLMASRTGNVAVAEVLLEFDADVRATSGKWWNEDSALTALMAAAEFGHADVARLLLEKGSEIEAMSAWGLTATMIAAYNNHTNVLRLLMASGDVPDRRSGGAFAEDSAYTALMLAASNGATAAMAFLLEHGAQPNLQTRDGWQPLTLAAISGNNDAVQLLLDHGAQLDPRTREGLTPVMLAAEAGDLQITRTLIARGADVKATSARLDGGAFGVTALMLTASGGHTQVIDLLLENGADVNARTEDGTTALMFAAAAGQSAVVAQLTDRRATVTAQAKDGTTALMMAAEMGHADVVEALLDHGAGLNTTSRSTFEGSGGTALMHAAAQGHIQVVTTLLTRGASISARNDQGMTALMMAAGAGHSDIVRLLLDEGADPNARDSDGDSPLGYYAAQFGHTDIVRILIEHGADVNAANNTGTTARAFAVENEHETIVAMLDEAGATPAADAPMAVPLSAYLPSVADLPPGVQLDWEERSPGGDSHQRMFSSAGMMFDLGSSQVAFIMTGSQLLPDSTTARAAITLAASMDGDALAQFAYPMWQQQIGWTPDSISVDKLEPPQVGQAALAWRMRMTSNFMKIDMLIVSFARDRLIGQVLAFGGIDEVHLADLIDIARLIDGKMEQGVPVTPAAAEPPARNPDPAALAKLGEGEDLARQGSIPEAIDAFDQAQLLDSLLLIPAESWNVLCWYGASWGHAAEVLDACERAVELLPEAWIRDSRGLARALTGNTTGAIEDFEAFVATPVAEEARSQRQEWIAALRAGNNPFTEEVLATLRGPDPDAADRTGQAVRDAGVDLPGMLPSASEIAAGTEVTAEGFEERADAIGSYWREFSAAGDNLFFTFRNSTAAGVTTRVTLYADPEAATASVEDARNTDQSVLARRFFGDELFDEIPSVTITVEPADVGNGRIGWKFSIDASFMQLEGYGILFSRGPIQADVALVGAPSSLALADVLAISQLVEGKIK